MVISSFICISAVHNSFHSVSFLSRVDELNNWPALHVWVFITQLVDHCSMNVEGTGLNPNETPKTLFFSGYFTITYIAYYNCDGHIFISLLLNTVFFLASRKCVNFLSLENTCNLIELTLQLLYLYLFLRPNTSFILTF